ncbi:hypothetical protein XELAEV_18045732mg [Xenopus laevis]|nr:hypothetical protein XELAEV_18045732mg [Xenopus laevis]
MLVLTGLSDNPSLQLPLFQLFFLIYLMTLTVNLLILLLIITDSHLHSSMYFLLGTLACLDMGYSSVTVPRMLYDLLTSKRIISLQACITQIFFFVFLAISEMCLLSVMSYDRYIAICRPLHYMRIMNWKACIQFVLIVLVFSAMYSLMHTLALTKLSFYKSDSLQTFFCDLPQLLQVSSSDAFINEMLIFVLGTLLAVVISFATFYPYITIIITVLKMATINMRSKAFSTLFSHLTVVVIFYSTLFFNYYSPDAKYHVIEDKVTSVFYTVLIPLLNPLIYSLRNQELKTSLRRALHRL